MDKHNVALVEDHALISRGFAEVMAGADDIDVVASVETVTKLMELDKELDLVVLDLRLNDGSSPTENVATIHNMGAEVLIYTGAEDRKLIQQAARSGALGLIRKSAPAEQLMHAVQTAAQGGEVFGTDWASAIDSASDLADAKLSPREEEVLSLYASGETANTVANRMGISRETVADYVTRIRNKYARVGRPARSRVDLYVRALEDGIVDGPAS